MILSFFFLLFALSGSGDAQSTVDFKADVLPIFERHCFECHGNGNREGELDLQTLAGVRAGGHSGSPLLAGQLEQSELFLRVTSTSDGYRMPKKGEPLSAEEIKTLAAWIQATSPNGAPKALGGNESGAAPDAGGLLWMNALTPLQQYQVIGTAVAIVLLLVYLSIRSVQTRKKKLLENPNREQTSVSAFGWAFRLLFAGLLCAAIIGFGYYYLLAGRLQTQVEKLKSQAAMLEPKHTVIAKPIGPNHLPLPASPMHPLRLGGRYYRGNDERDPSLYNGGFYRTATIDLRLIDAEGNLLEWGDDVADQQFVEIIIERAPEATRELFSERVRGGVTLLHFDQLNGAVGGEGEKFQFEAEKLEQRWTAVVPVSKAARAEGMIYMMYGVDHAVKTPSGEAAPRPHFGIRYEIDIADGQLASTSSLWMGSMYTLGGRVMVPGKGQVLLDRWFDWREIPTIQGQGSSDSKLIGLPEHLLSE